MARLRLTDKADFGVMYDADKLRYKSEDLAALGITRERAIEIGSAYPSIGYEIDGVAAGGAVFDGKQLHLAVLPEFHGRWAWLLKPTLDWLFALCDPVQVRIEKFNTRCLRFMDAGGWRRIGEDKYFVIYLVSSEIEHIFRRRGKGKPRTA